MLKSITLENFFSFREKTTIHLNEGVNVLVGINGSGKSNFIKAIRLLYEGVAGIGFEKVFLQEWGGFDSVANFNGEISYDMELTFEFEFSKTNVVYNFKIFRSGVTSYFFKETVSYTSKEKKKRKIILDIENGEGKIVSEDNNNTNHVKIQGHKVHELILSKLLIRDRSPILQSLLRFINSLNIYAFFDTSFNGIIRQPSSYRTEDALLQNGENLAYLLNQIKNHQSLEYETIENLLKNINPNFKDIGFDILGSKYYLVLREKYLSKSVSLENISDGTLRFLLLLSIFFNIKRGKLVCLDEPEMGLHPDMINTICEGIKHASKTTQMIIATHSPLLLNSFELSDILIFEKNANNETIVFQKDDSDFEDLESEILAGQLWLIGKLGGKRW